MGGTRADSQAVHYCQTDGVGGLRNGVKAKQGAAGVDEASLAGFEGSNLSKLWNRPVSGRDFPPPVRTVAIPKRDGGQRL